MLPQWPSAAAEEVAAVADTKLCRTQSQILTHTDPHTLTPQDVPEIMSSEKQAADENEIENAMENARQQQQKAKQNKQPS